MAKRLFTEEELENIIKDYDNGNGLSSNVDLNSIDVQKVPILFDLQNAKKDLQEQLASGNLSQEQDSFSAERCRYY